MVMSDSLLKCKRRRRKLHVLEVLIEVYDQASAFTAYVSDLSWCLFCSSRPRILKVRVCCQREVEGRVLAPLCAGRKIMSHFISEPSGASEPQPYLPPTNILRPFCVTRQ